MRSNHAKATQNWQRLTGQASTALGNVSINFLVHMSFVKKNYNLIRIMLALGDDNLMALAAKPDVSKLKQNIKLKYNMQS